jgi:hypothetical protein
VCSSVAVSCLACARPWAPTTAFQNKNKNSWVLVTQNCIHSYSGGSNQEDHSSKPAWTNSWWGPISKKPDIKEDWWSGSNCRLEFKPQYCKKKKKKGEKESFFIPVCPLQPWKYSLTISFPFQLLYSQVDPVGMLTRILATPILFFPNQWNLCRHISHPTPKK